MKQLCITSDVSCKPLIINRDLLRSISELHAVSVNNQLAVTQIRDRQLQLLEKELLNVIPQLLLDRDELSSKTPTQVFFNENALRLNLRNDKDFNICALINLYDITKCCVNTHGTLYLFDREAFRENKSDIIIAFLRGITDGLSEKQIGAGVSELWQKHDINDTIDAAVLNAGLRYLQTKGMVYYNDVKGLFCLTPRGHMFF